MQRALVASFTTLLCLAAAPAHAVTLEQAMADPDWIGPPVQQPYWSVDGRSLYYRLKRAGSPVRDLHRIELAGGKDAIVDPAAMAGADGADAVFDRSRSRAAFVRNGDVFLRDVASGRLTQVTRTPQAEASPQFSADGRALQYRSGSDWFVYDIAGAVAGPAAIVRTEKDPAAKKPDDLAQQQLRYFSTLRKLKADRDAQKQYTEEFTAGDPTRAPMPFYVGDEVKIEGTSLAPDGKHLLVVTSPKGYESGRSGKLQRFVTESGYEEQEDERTRVGRNDPAPQSLLLLDLAKHEQHALALDDLPGIHDDPLKAVREENDKRRRELGLESKPEAKDKKADKKDDKPKARTVRIVSDAEDGGGGGIVWSEDGAGLAIQIRAIDNKDRWIATVDFERAKLAAQHRLTDPAWINWGFNDFGWLKDGRTLWYLSEESGYSQIYSKANGGKATALTRGAFEISSPTLSPDGRWFYVRANVEAPYAYDVYRVATGGGSLERVTNYQAAQQFALSPDGRQLAVLHSSAYVPAQLAIAGAEPGAAPRELTDTRTAEYKAMSWLQPAIVAVPSSHTKQPIYAKFYKPKDFDASKKYPAVLFVHGAGYLQNVHLGFPAYFREQMFHNLLTERGYVVLDMDYRASEGYGRDWRTAIYRQMGHPELEDLIDGVHWLEKNASADPQRVGLYGGSYGGFMSLMAMFRAPEMFKAGAALRPVTDWAQYNHEYTSNILNTPQVDPIAYERSSPIEFADGLKGSLLIAHGMIDDNVLFEDSVRLYQKLIELKKDNFELAGYPLERHGFVHADAWLDEYKRIYKLFETTLNRGAAP
ncbi:prolyl oligopeptidase family serine peptidase [Dokdonella sp.]|uniref:S9 family peptidase n=1 Tax=Dokdonella sp. TaxID=2291710 RepID=UPI001B08825A|nr:prolyl oligopeptidase family serine peptidase [Dokdonella sp.]MBO9662044.1 S9 family peptidase [Dokdonella sp.]